MKRIYLSDEQRGKFRREGRVCYLARTQLARGGAGAVFCGEEYLVAENYEELGQPYRGDEWYCHRGWRDRRYTESEHLKKCRVVACREVEVGKDRIPMMSDEEWSKCAVDLASPVYKEIYAKKVLRDDRRVKNGKALESKLVLIEIVIAW